MSRYLMAFAALAALLFTVATPSPAEAGKRFRYTCIGPVHTFHGCYRLVGRTVRGVPIRVRPAAPVYFLFWRIG